MVSAVVDRGNGGPWEWRTPGMADPNQFNYRHNTKTNGEECSALPPAMRITSSVVMCSNISYCLAVHDDCTLLIRAINLGSVLYMRRSILLLQQ